MNISIKRNIQKFHFLPTKMEIILLKEQILKLNLLAPFQFC